MCATTALLSLKKRLQRQQQKAIQRFRLRPRPAHLLLRLSRNTDQALHRLVSLYALPTDSALVALGGYGRQELYPYSDVDLLVLLAQPPTDQDRHSIEKFIAALWDIGLKAASSVRTIEQCLSQAHTDVATQTALLEARHLQGNLALYHHLKEQLQLQLDPRAFYTAKVAEMRQRHAHYHNTPYALEPNCKESPGALRDLQLLLWLVKAMGLAQSWSDIAQSQLLSTSEVRALSQAMHAFMRLRIELHLLSGRAEDRVLFDYQPELAKRYGINAQTAQQASEKLMQRYYWAARTVVQMNTIFMQSLAERLFAPATPHLVTINEHFELRNQRLHLKNAAALPLQPQLIFEGFLLLQRHSSIQELSADTLRAFWHARTLITPHFRQNPQHKQLFLNILQQPHKVLYCLCLMNRLNILPRYIPEFRHIVGQMQHDLFHVYTVDQHTLMVIANLRRFHQPTHSQPQPLAHQLMQQFQRPWVLTVAALFHDIAKGRGGNHALLGAQDALRFCQQHQLNTEDTDLVVFLVKEHLLMSMTAQKRDLSDPQVIHSFSLQVGSKRQLQALYLLTVADIQGTNPTIWNAWKAKLLQQLYDYSLNALKGKHQATAEVLARRQATALHQLLQQGISQEQIDTWWGVLDRRYFLRHPSEDIIWHATELHSAVLAAQPIIRLRILGVGDAIQLLIYTPDRADLFMHICAFFDQQQMNIQDARIYTTLHGWALDSFVLLLAPHQQNNPTFSTHLQSQLAQYVLNPPPTLAQPPVYAPQSQSRRARAFPIPTQIDIQHLPHPSQWRISIVCADHKGLLYNVAHVLAQYKINVKLAKITTLGERAEDVFIVHSHHLHRPAFLQQVKRSLQAALY